MTPDALRNRTKTFAVRVLRLVRVLPRTDDARVIGRQLLRSSTSVGASYRAVCRPRSDADFVAKLGTTIEECDETAFWLELMLDADVVTGTTVTSLLAEADELTRIFVASRETVRRRIRAKRTGKR